MAGMVGGFLKVSVSNSPELEQNYPHITEWKDGVKRNVFPPWAVTAEAKFSFGSW